MIESHGPLHLFDSEWTQINIMARMTRLLEKHSPGKFLGLKLLFCCRNSEEMQTWRCQLTGKSWISANSLG